MRPERKLFGHRGSTYREIAELERAVHAAWWGRYAAASGFAEVSQATVLSEIARVWMFSALPTTKKAFLTAVVEHCCDAEKTRGRPDLPLRFRTDWSNGAKTEYYYTHATFPTEFVHIVVALEQAPSWPWDTRLTGQRKLAYHYQYRSEPVKTVATIPSPSTTDAVTGELEINRLYTNDLYDGLRTGRYRLYAYGAAGPEAFPTYIAVPASDENARDQGTSVAKSLSAYHTLFKGDAKRNVATLKPIDVSESSNADADHRFMLACLGVRVLVLDVYTATFRIASPDLDGTLVVTLEGYFASRIDAEQAFKDLNPQAKLMAVRPGPKVIGDALRDRARKWTPADAAREDVFVLQNELLGRLGEGLILLDQVSNAAEVTFAKLAGTGVFLSWWWSLSGRTRRTLISALKDLQVQQALRAEIMCAFLEVHRMHVLSHPYFDGKTYSEVAERSEKLLKAAVNKAITGDRP